MEGKVKTIMEPHVESKFFTSQSSFSCVKIFVHVAHLFFFCFCEVLHIYSASYAAFFRSDHETVEV
jgi:hypothetical protein